MSTHFPEHFFLGNTCIAFVRVREGVLESKRTYVNIYFFGRTDGNIKFRRLKFNIYFLDVFFIFHQEYYVNLQLIYANVKLVNLVKLFES